MRTKNIESAKKQGGGQPSEEKKSAHKIHAPVTATTYVPVSVTSVPLGFTKSNEGKKHNESSASKDAA